MRTGNILVSVRGVKIKLYNEIHFMEGEKITLKTASAKKQYTILKIIYCYLKSLP